MKPLNQKERNNMFFQFLLFYVVSIVVVLFAAFGNIQSGIKQVGVLKNENTKLKEKISLQSNFMKSMSKAEEIVFNANTQPELVSAEGKFSRELDNMKSIANKTEDTTWANEMGLLSIISGFKSRWDEKDQLVKQNEDQNVLSNLQDKLHTCQQNYDKLELKYEALAAKTGN